MDTQLKFVEYATKDASELVKFISQEEWPYHGSSKPQQNPGHMSCLQKERPN